MKQETFPKIVFFRVSSDCNNDCEYCYWPDRGMKELSTDEIKKLFHFLSERGVEGVVLTGGEPLLRKDFEEIIIELKKQNLKIFLDTNGDLFNKYADLISNNVDMIGLPLDFADKSYRSQQNLSKVFEALEYLKNQKVKPLIRIGTVVTKHNLMQLEQIGNLLAKYPVSIWKIYQFVPAINSNSIKNQSSLGVSEAEFFEATKKLNQFSKHFTISLSSMDNRDKAYFFIFSNGVVFNTENINGACLNKQIGNVYEKDIIAKWTKTTNHSNYSANLRATFK